MKFSTIFAFASTAAFAVAAPASVVSKRADYCGQWDNQIQGPYTIYNNLWGRDAATSGSQCTGVDGLSGSTLKWHTKWSWAGGAGHVKSYANVVTKISQKSLSSIKSLRSVWTWSYSGSNLIANVSYDLFTGKTATGTQEYEVMIWMAALGGAGPISTTGKPIATPTIGGKQYNLYKGPNGQMTVFSFVAVSQIKSFNGDLNEFLVYLRNSQGLPSTQILQSVGAGTEPFSGSNAVMTTTAFSMTQQ
ncbi:concanavalin A-like lectin/glucanase domain-containing protein [Boeremia exigua]|uniref:concanavalin A-like lectin/glucanase domain-containing protein n=1 Tax=Boeremia exigua TaxID=749465 RepID=UPI001E8D6E49|nr:concanavalin A-like lectin/glucanase domain-containing protein [Boeremia exigua]KAH6644527.1 concanavalin A-like lectin/glucanase domain-containing protein [Boeremia exigua]